MQPATAFSFSPATEEETMSLSALAPEWCARPVERMRMALGDAFLLHLGSLDGARQPLGFLRTMSVEHGDGVATGGLLAGGNVYAVRATGRCPFPNFVSIGRTRNNDVVLPDISVSKFHAYLRPENGRYKIQDAGSQNGTWVKGERLSAKESVALEPGLALRLGGLELTYLDASGLHEILCRVSARTA